MKKELLPRELVWQPDGHLFDTAIAALADGQDLVSPEAQSHADMCEQCARRIGEEALASLAVREALVEGQAHALVASSRRQPRPLPVGAVMGALALAAAGMAPVIQDLPQWATETTVLAARVSPVLLRGAIAALRGIYSSQVVVVSAASLLVVALASFVASRLAPSRVASAYRSSKEGVVQ